MFYFPNFVCNLTSAIPLTASRLKIELDLMINFLNARVGSLWKCCSSAQKLKIINRF